VTTPYKIPVGAVALDVDADTVTQVSSPGHKDLSGF